MTLLVGSDWRSLLKFPGLVLLGHRFGVVSCTLMYTSTLRLAKRCSHFDATVLQAEYQSQFRPRA